MQHLRHQLIFLKLVYTPLKKVSKGTEFDVGKSQNRWAYHEKIFSYESLQLPNFRLGQI